MAENRCQRATCIFQIKLRPMQVPPRFWQWFYDRVAFAYDWVLRAGAWLHIGSEEIIRREVIGEFDLPDEELIMEIGCGTASNREFLPQRARYLGLDISRRMLRRARDKCRRLGLPALFVQADANALPLANYAIGACLAMGVLQHLPFPNAAIREMQRASRAGALLLLIDEKRARSRIISALASDQARISFANEYFVMQIRL